MYQPTIQDRGKVNIRLQIVALLPMPTPSYSFEMVKLLTLNKNAG